MSGKGSIHIGTSGWVYPHWKTVFYPTGLPLADKGDIGEMAENNRSRFFDVFAVMAKQVGSVLIQLRAILTFQEEKASKFFEYLHHFYGGFRFSLEARHSSWTAPAAVVLLKKYRIGWVIADSGSRFA